MTTTTTIDPEAIMRLADEPHTPGEWLPGHFINANTGQYNSGFYVTIDGSRPEAGSDLEGISVEVAVFARPADARRAMACLKACEDLPTSAIEALPESVSAMLARVIHAQLAAFQLTQKAQDEEAWAQLRKDILEQVAKGKPTTH